MQLGRIFKGWLLGWILAAAARRNGESEKVRFADKQGYLLVGDVN